MHRTEHSSEYTDIWIDQGITEMDNDKISSLFVDVSKVFDTCDHKISQNKLK